LVELPDSPKTSGSSALGFDVLDGTSRSALSALLP
jgi:hypothetical protein